MINHPVVLLLGPHREAVSGVSTHVNLLMGSTLADEFELLHFQVGREGRAESAFGRLMRLVFGPLALAATIVFRHVSIVHINTSLNPRAFWRDLAYLLVAKALGARTVYQVHGGALPQAFFAGSNFLTALLARVLRMPDVVVVLAQCELVAYRRFIPGQDVVLLPNGIDCRPFNRVPTVNSPGGPLRLTYIGRLAREKGLYETLQAVRLAQELGADCRIVIAGGGPEESRLRRYAQALGIAHRVTFAGPVFGDDKVKVLEGSDVVMLASYAEGLPYSLLEAMAAGVPVIATPVGAIPDVVSDGIHGVIVPVRDGKAIAEALSSLAIDRERLSWMSRACRRRIRAAFNIDRLSQEMALQYNRLLGHAVAAGTGSATASPSKGAVKRRVPQEQGD